MNTILRFFAVVSCSMILLPTQQVFGQADSCGFDEPQEGALTQIGGYQITSLGTVKALLIFIDFPDDSLEPYNSLWPTLPSATGPTYLNTIVDETEEQNSGFKENITTFFRRMSYDQFTMIGKAYYMQAPHPLSWYIANHGGDEPAYATKDAIELLDDTVDFSDFDRWTYNGPFDHTAGPDGKLDMVFVCFRRWYAGYGFYALGWYYASLPGGVVNVDKDERRIISSQAVDVLEMWQKRLDVTLHEFGHLWGLPHNYGGGLWTLMGYRHPSVSSFMNSYEREQLGWINFNNVTVDGTTATISDFATTGVAYRIAIPNTNPQEFFLFENHQQISLYDTVDISLATGPGLYILHDNGYRYVDANNLRVCSADGKWNWSNPHWIQNVFNPGNPLDSIPVFQRGTINRASGESDKVAHRTTKVDIYGNPIYYLTFAWRDEQTGELKTGQRFKGDGNDRFTYQENNVFSPWSAYGAYNWAGTAITSIGLEITGTSGSNINVKFYTTNPVNAAPSKPASLNVSAGNGQPELIWTVNVEPDVNPNGTCLIERRYKFEEGEWTSWIQVASVGGDVTHWTDEDIDFQYLFGANDSLQYRIRAKDTQNKLSVYSEVASLRGHITLPKRTNPSQVPLVYELWQNYPNPFNPSTTIRYALPEASHVSLVIYDVLGRKVVELENGVKEAGYRAVVWDANNVASGVYFARFTATDASGNIRLSKVGKLLFTK